MYSLFIDGHLSEDGLRGTALHEIGGHVSTGSVWNGFEGTNIVNPYSVISQNLLEAGQADIKNAKLRYGRYPLGEPFNQILGLKFLDE